MIGMREFVLTLAAIFLLTAALNRKSRVIRASASQVDPVHAMTRGFNSSSLRAQNGAPGVINTPTILKQLAELNNDSNQTQAKLSPDRRNQNKTQTPSLTGRIITNEIEPQEQQQQPPFTLSPQFNQQQQLQQLLQQQQLNGQSLPQQNIRQILHNYQRYPQSLEHQRLLNQQQHNSGNPASAFRQNPPQYQATPQQQGLGNQAQQPFSPIHLLTGPLQAFLPGLNPANYNQQPLPPPQTSNAAKPQPSNSKAKGSAGNNQPATGAAIPQTSPPLPTLFNPFAPQAAVGQQQQLPNLQALYQQLPLYQALLAARQRQEALQAAQKVQQLQPQNNGLNVNQPHLTSPYAQPQPAFGVFNQPQRVNNLWPLQPQQQPPYSPQLNQPSPTPILPQQPVVQQPPVVDQQHPNGNPGAVQFDDDNEQNNNANNGQNGPNVATNNPVNNDNSSNNQENQNSNDEQQNNQNNNDTQDHNNQQEPANEQQNDNQGGGGNAGNNESAKPEEEDPDLKQFQNLANGGDSFTDLFPPGILSNNDISEIKQQQKEQAKKQEEEERQRQQQNQNQHQDHQQQQQQQQQPPIDQFANQNPQQVDNNNIDQNNGVNQPAEENGNDAEGNDGGGEDQGGDGTQDDGGEGGGEEENPTAAALTAKSESSESMKKEKALEKKKLTQSPGVEYST